jgi:hypothetical protein
MDRSAKYLKSLVGAPRFELGTSCAQGRRATRLRYAPTCIALLILKHFPTLLLIRTITYALDCVTCVTTDNAKEYKTSEFTITFRTISEHLFWGFTESRRVIRSIGLRNRRRRYATGSTSLCRVVLRRTSMKLN